MAKRPKKKTRKDKIRESKGRMSRELIRELNAPECCRDYYILFGFHRRGCLEDKK